MMDKPKFSDLRPDEVDALIAEKIMGYTFNAGASNPRDIWMNGERKVGPFIPYASLDDCWEAEEKLSDEPARKVTVINKAQLPKGLTDAEIERMLEDGHIPANAINKVAFAGTPEHLYKYQQILLAIASRDHRVDKAPQSWGYVHATPQQKCEALLLAIGEIQ